MVLKTLGRELFSITDVDSAILNDDNDEVAQTVLPLNLKIMITPLSYQGHEDYVSEIILIYKR